MADPKPDLISFFVRVTLRGKELLDSLWACPLVGVVVVVCVCVGGVKCNCEGLENRWVVGQGVIPGH